MLPFTHEIAPTLEKFSNISTYLESSNIASIRCLYTEFLLIVDVVSHISSPRLSLPPEYVIFPKPPFASIKSRNPEAEEMLPLIDSSVFLAMIVVVVVLMDEFLFIFFETAVTIIVSV